MFYSSNIGEKWTRTRQSNPGDEERSSPQLSRNKLPTEKDKKTRQISFIAVKLETTEFESRCT